jgi:probable phosphoglycerate mutase
VEIAFVRHAQPAWIADGVGVLDPGLTEIGTTQADRVAAGLADDRPWDELIVSSAIRAERTAAPVAAALGLRPEVVPDLTEMRLPDLEGTPAEQVAAFFHECRKRPVEEWWDGYPGGESFRDFHERITGVVRGLLAERGVTDRPEPHLWDLAADPGRVLIVAHGGTNAVALGFLLGLDPTPWEWERFVSPHASISRVRTIPLAGGHIFGLTAFGEVGHLETVTL